MNKASVGTDDPDGPMTLKGFLIAGILVIGLVAGLLVMKCSLSTTEQLIVELPQLRPDIRYVMVQYGEFTDDDFLIFRGYYFRSYADNESTVYKVYICQGEYYLPGKNTTQSVKGQYIMDVSRKYIRESEDFRRGCEL